MHLNHPETIPLPLVHWKIVFHETGPWCQNVGDHCSTLTLSSNLGPTSAPTSAASAPSVLAGAIDVLTPDRQLGRNAENGAWTTPSPSPSPDSPGLLCKMRNQTLNQVRGFWLSELVISIASSFDSLTFVCLLSDPDAAALCSLPQWTAALGPSLGVIYLKSDTIYLKTTVSTLCLQWKASQFTLFN